MFYNPLTTAELGTLQQKHTYFRIDDIAPRDKIIIRLTVLQLFDERISMVTVYHTLLCAILYG